MEGSSREGMSGSLQPAASREPDASGHSVRHSMAVIEAAKLAQNGMPMSEFDRD